MNIKTSDIARETIIVLSGAILAAVIIGQLPGLREWMRKQWDGAAPNV
jgi:hypothetical protein